jgi:hypothetical protein
MFKKNNLIGVLAVAITVFCVGRFAYKQFNRYPKVDVQPFATLGSLVADETSKLLPSGGKVVVLSVDTAKYNIPTLDTLLSAFRKGLKGNITISSVEKFRIPPSVFMALSSGSLVPPTADFSASQFVKVVQTYSSADAIISFVGLPPSLSGNAGELQQKRPRIVVVSNRDPELVGFLKSHIIDLAIVPRAEPATEQEAKDLHLKQNKRTYEILTSDK